MTMGVPLPPPGDADWYDWATEVHGRLVAIEPGATADQTAAQIKTAYESNPNTNAYTDGAVARLAASSNFSSPNGGGVIVGNYYDNAFHGVNNANTAGAANRFELAPFFTNIDLPIDEIGISVNSGIAAAQGKVAIYATGADGWPGALLYESAALDYSSGGYKFAALTFTFLSGVTYWLGHRHSSTASIRTVANTSLVSLGLNSSNGNSYNNTIRKVVAFADAAPNPWVFSAAELTSAVMPSVRFRAAA